MLESLDVILSGKLKIQLDGESMSSEVSEVTLKPFSLNHVQGNKKKKFRKLKQLFRNVMLEAERNSAATSGNNDSSPAISKDPEEEEPTEEEMVGFARQYVLSLMSLDRSFDLDYFTEIFIDFVEDNLIFVKGIKKPLIRFHLERLEENDLEKIMMNYVAAFFLDYFIENLK